MATIQVNLEFNANTKNAKQQIQDLQNTLNSAISNSMSGKNLGISPQLDQARQSALQLKVALEGATNVNTGKLNLIKFTNSLRSSGISIAQLATQLKSLGPQGVQAFNQMASAMASAETQLFSLSGGMQRLVNTFFNTVRYQASAMAIQTVTKSITSAISYTKNLDKALTDIAIVTQDSSFNMAKFAVQANKAAKSLATTTTEYTKAAHIYFQQGLDTSEAMKRAETTIRLAHATGESMEEVSNWMTAIWNNFDDGTKPLEYYGDVLAKLGAATASSADEIAQGLEKFAAVAETVGLSYEYAASALATITAETRQSADVVGTALKTLFSRMESLSLGKTLDDGTTLNKYSLALQTVGVQIKDANGGLKDMDQILDETATRWEILSKDQQIALAQSVAGVRQYTQFIALMDNYDIMKNNIDMSKKASGSLQEMQETYKNSIEGIQAESKAAGEGLISSLMDEDDIKNFYKAMTGIAEFATKLTKSFGGLEGILLTLSAAMLKMYQPKVATFIQNTAYGLQDLKTKAQNAGRSFTNLFRSKDHQKPMLMTTGEQMREEALQRDSLMQQQQMGGMAGTKVTQQINDLKMNLYRNEKKLTDEAKQQIQWQIQLLELTRDNLAEEEKRLEVVRQTNMEKGDAINENVLTPEQQKTKTNNINKMTTASQNAVRMLPSIDTVTTPGYDSTADAEKLISYLKEARRVAQELELDISDLGFDNALAGAELFKNGSLDDFEQLQSKIISINSELQKIGATSRMNVDASSIAVDTNYIQTRGEAIGQMEYGTEATINMAKNQQQIMINSGKETMHPEQRQSLGANMLKSLEDSKVKAEQLGMDVKNLGFEDAESDIKKFADTGELELNELIKKLEEFQSKIQQAGIAELKNTVENAGIGALDETVAGYNQIQNASFQSGTDNQASAAISGVEKMGEKASSELKQKSNDLKDLQDRRKQLKQLQTQELKNAKTEQDKIKIENKYGKLLKDNKKLIQNKIKDIQKDTKETNKNINEQKDAVKSSEEYNDLMDERGEKMTAAAVSSKNLGKEEAALQGKVDSTGDSIKALNDKITAGGEKIQSFGSRMASGLSTMMSVVSGINMLKNGFQQLTTALAEGEYGFDTWASAAMSILPALMQILPSIISVTSAVYTKVGALMAAKAASKAEADQEVKDSGRKVAANIVEGTSGVAKNVAKGYAFWPAAIAGVAALAMVGATIALPLLAGNKASKEEVEQERLEQQGAVNSAASEVSKSVDNLVEQGNKFKELRDSGQSTVEMFEEMKGSVDDTCTQIKNLNKELEKLKKMKGNTSAFSEAGNWIGELKEAYEKFLITGDIDEYNEKTTGIQKKIKHATVSSTWQTYYANWQNGKDKDAIEDSRGQFITALGESAAINEDAVSKAEKKFHSKKYNSVQEAKKEWALAFVQSVFGDIDTRVLDDQNIDEIYGFAPQSVLRTISGLRLFEGSGSISNKYGQETAKKARAWAEKDPVRMQYLDLIDLSQPEDTWNNQLTEAIQKTTFAQNALEAQQYNISDEAFKAYTNALMKENDALKENEALASEVALQTVKMGKGIGTLIEKYDDIKDALDEGADAGFKYYEAIATVQTALKEAFGFEVRDTFVEDNLGLIKRIANGSVEALDQLRKQLSSEFIATFNYRTATKDDEDIGLNMGEQKLLFQQMQNEVFQSSTLNIEKYKDQLNSMIKAGQLTAKEIEGFFGSMDLVVDMPDKEWVTTGQIRHTYVDQKTGDTRIEEETIEEWLPVFSKDTQIAKAPQSKSVMKTAQDLSGNDKREDKKAKDEIERYHEIEKALSTLEKQYNALSAAKDNAFGAAKLGYLDQEIEKCQELVDKQKEMVAEAEAYLELDRKSLSKYGAGFDEYGNLTNYDEIMKAAIGAYNSGNIDDDGYQAVLDAISHYEESQQNFLDQTEALREKERELFNKKLEKIQTKVDIQFNLSDLEIEHVEFLMENLSDDATDAAKKIALMGRSADANIKKAEASAKAFEETLELSGFTAEEISQIMSNPDNMTALLEGKELTQAQADALQEYAGNLRDATSALIEMRNQIPETLLAAFENMNDELDKGISKIEHMQNLMEGYANIIELAGEEFLGINPEIMKQMRETQLSIAKDTVAATKSRLEMNTAQLASMRQMYESASEEDKKKLKDAMDEIEQKVWEDQESLLDAINTGLEIATENFNKEMDFIIKTFESSIAGAYGTLESLQASLEEAKALDDFYLDDYQKIYELSKMTRDINKSIDETDNIRAKEKLREIQEQIIALQESGVEMTQYEVDALRAKYDLRLAEIALEEAQNAKSQVRMSRDSEGNWGYVYTADESKITNAEQNYEDKLYNYQQLMQGYTDEMLNQLATLAQEEAEAARAVYESNLTPEERELRLQEIRDYYGEMRDNIISQLETVMGDSAKLYREDWANYSQLTGYKISADEKWIDSFEETVFSQKTGFKTLDEAQIAFEESSIKMLDNLAANYVKWQEDMSDILDEGIDNWREFFGSEDENGTFAGIMSDMRDESTKTKEAIEEMSKVYQEQFAKMTEAATQWLDTYSSQVEQWQGITETIGEATIKLIDYFSNVGSALQDVIDKYEVFTGYAGIPIDGPGSGNNGEGVSISGKYLISDPDGEKGATWGNKQLENVTNGVVKSLKPVDIGGKQYWQVQVNANGKTEEIWMTKDEIEKVSVIDKTNIDKYIDPNGKYEYAMTTYLQGRGTYQGIGVYKKKQYADGHDPSQKADYYGVHYVKILKIEDDAAKIQFKGDNQSYYITLGALTRRNVSKDVAGFDTGGYTGSWDSSGRLAMLHQKEIVLNAHDTENFLAGINVLRDITSAIDLQALQYQHKLAQYAYAQVAPSYEQALLQEVTIHAEFPNATERSEIEAAFDTLLNRASQFANRKN